MKREITILIESPKITPEQVEDAIRAAFPYTDQHEITVKVTIKKLK